MSFLLNTLVAALSAFLIPAENKTGTTEEPLTDQVVVIKEPLTERPPEHCCIVQ